MGKGKTKKTNNSSPPKGTFVGVIKREQDGADELFDYNNDYYNDFYPIYQQNSRSLIGKWEKIQNPKEKFPTYGNILIESQNSNGNRAELLKLEPYIDIPVIVNILKSTQKSYAPKSTHYKAVISDIRCSIAPLMISNNQVAKFDRDLIQFKDTISDVLKCYQDRRLIVAIPCDKWLCVSELDSPKDGSTRYRIQSTQFYEYDSKMCIGRPKNDTITKPFQDHVDDLLNACKFYAADFDQSPPKKVDNVHAEFSDGVFRIAPDELPHLPDEPGSDDDNGGTETDLPKLNDEISEAKEELKRIQEECARAKKEEQDAIKDYNQWNELTDKLIDDFKNKCNQLVNDLRIEITNPDFARVTVDNHLANVLTRASAEWEREHDADAVTPVVQALREAIPKQPEKIRDELVTAIQSVRKHYSTNDILNVAICMTQGFLTVFSGSPGCGKTSLCRNMATLLKLNEKVNDMECRRFVDISVGRGWTSQRDFIGYYNPLSGHFETGNADMYRALQMLDAESRSEGSRYPLYVLLDEANLSPMEHYWSDFIGICDAKRDSDRVIDCGGGKTFKIPETLRFLATINNDDTTTVLSPRLIDRAWIITLPEPTLAQMLNSGKDELENSDLTGFGRISWETLTNAFGVQADKSGVRKKLQDVLTTLLGETDKSDPLLSGLVTVSPRIFNAMVDYCTAAVNCFEGDEKQTEAFDFVIAQKLLPQISAMEYGTDSVEKQLGSVEKWFRENGYDRSEKIMERIISKGSDLGYYRFF